MPGTSLLSQSSTNKIIPHTIPLTDFLLTQMIECTYVMPISSIVPPYPNVFSIRLPSYSFIFPLFFNDCMHLMTICNIVPPFPNRFPLDLVSYSFFLFLFDLLLTLGLITETLWLFFCPIVGSKIPCNLHTVTRLFHWSVCTLCLTRFDTLIASKENGPTNATALSPNSGNRVDHWMNLELHGVTEGLILILSP